jgi:hypothetical protein
MTDAQATMTAVWLQAAIDNAPADSEAVMYLRGPMVTPLIRERVKTAADLKFMRPRRTELQRRFDAIAEELDVQA